MKLVYLRINMSIGENEVGPTVIVEIKKHGAPTQILRVLVKTGSEGDVRKNSVSVVTVQGGRVVGEVSFEKIQPAVTVVIGDGGSHAGLFATLFVEGDSGHNRYVGESSIVIVVVKGAG